MMNECCKNAKNLVVVDQDGSVLVRRCVVCARRHYEMDAKPGVIFARDGAEQKK